MSLPMTTDQFREALPPQMRKNVSQELIDSINNTLKDPEAMEVYRDNLLSYTHVLREGKFKLPQYLNAVKYVSFKVGGLSNTDAYIKTFPNKYQDFLQRGVPDKDIASYITAYNKSKLVNLIYEQTLIPIHIINASLLQKAINTQAELMLTAKSEMVRSQAAACLIKELKPPETKKFELDIAVKEDSAIASLRATTAALVEQQKALLAQGVGAKQIAHTQLLIEGELEEVDE